MNPNKPSTSTHPAARKPQASAQARNASNTRQRIFAAARQCFSSKSYENVGIREIASEAGVDAALVSRYFGGKEPLFAEVIQGAFDVAEHLPTRLEDIGKFLVEQVLNDSPDTDNEGFNPLRVLLLAAASPDTSAIVSTRFQAEFVQPLAKRLGGKHADARASLIASYVIGLATMRHLLKAPALETHLMEESKALVMTAIQACVVANDLAEKR